MGIIIFDKRSSEDYHIIVEHPPGYDYPSKDYEYTHIPGRSGDFLLNKNSYNNTTRTYQIAVGDPDEAYVKMANRISEWLFPTEGYARLEDSYEPDYYRMAALSDSFSLDNIVFHAGRTEISFNCKPQRYLKSGENFIRINGLTKIKNPTSFKALPLVKIHGSGNGTFSINGKTITISNITDGMEIDSDLQDAYYQNVNKNKDIILTDGEFPKLTMGINEIVFSGGITSLEVIPRWWTV